MLKSYSAQINGSQLIWIDAPPHNLKRQPVLVVIDNNAPVEPAANTYDVSDLVGRLAWRGNAAAAQRAQRDAW
jgi:hypothetical protein